MCIRDRRESSRLPTGRRATNTGRGWPGPLRRRFGTGSARHPRRRTGPICTKRVAAQRARAATLRQDRPGRAARGLVGLRASPVHRTLLRHSKRPLLHNARARDVYKRQDVSTIMGSIQNGMGGTLGFIATVVGLGAMFGKMLEISGGAERLARTFINAFGVRRSPWAMVISGFLVSIPCLLYTSRCV